MGFLNGSISVTRISADDMSVMSVADICNSLQGKRFVPADSIPFNAGWTNIVDPYNDSPSIADSCVVNNEFIIFGLRIDQIKVPAVLLKKEYSSAISIRMKTSETPLSKADKIEIRESVLLHLLKKTLPVPSVTELVYHVPTQKIYALTTSNKILSVITDLLEASFGIQFLPIFLPDLIAARMPDSNGFETRMQAQALADNVSQWFLTWLWFKMRADCAGAVQGDVALSMGQVASFSGGGGVISISSTEFDFEDILPEIRKYIAENRLISNCRLVMADESEKIWSFKTNLALKIGALSLPQFDAEEMDSGIDDDGLAGKMWGRASLLILFFDRFDAFVNQFVDLILDDSGWRRESSRILEWASKDLEDKTCSAQ